MHVASNNSHEQKIIDQVYQANQEHVFNFWNELHESSRKKLLQQLGEIDFDLLSKFKQLIQNDKSPFHQKNLEPADFIPIPETPEQRQAALKAEKIGEEALRAGRVAAFLVAGGQGTRLGFSGPKGVFPISPVVNKSLFQLHAEKILALSRKYNAVIPWYIMTSETNHEETTGFFETNNYFGFNPRDVIFFRQEMVPALTSQGKLILDGKNHIFTNPNGHGGSLSALKKSGALQDMRNRDRNLIFYFQVDNVLIKICDPVFLGYHIQNEAQMSAKIVTKTDPEEKVGVLAHIDGKLGVIEYSDLPETKKYARNQDGTLKFCAGSIAIHIFDVEFVEQENVGGLRLPWHVAHKKVPYLDKNGNYIEPEKPNAYKFETFVFDALGDASRTNFLEVRREDEFSPVKNAKGIDSQQTACRDMVNLFGKWLEAAGKQIPRDSENNVKGKIEISALYALDEKELIGKINPDLTFQDNLYLG